MQDHTIEMDRAEIMRGIEEFEGEVPMETAEVEVDIDPTIEMDRDEIMRSIGTVTVDKDTTTINAIHTLMSKKRNK